MKTANRRRREAGSYAHAGLDDSLKRKLQNPDFRAGIGGLYSAEN
jgi:hypothetical protein